MATKSKKLARQYRRKSKRRQQRIEAAATPKELTLVGDSAIDIQAAEGDEQTLPTFTMTAYSGGRMRPRFFAEDVVVDLSGMRVANGNLPIFLGHDSSQIVGHSTEITTDNGIQASGIISGSGPAANEVIANAKNGFPWKASIGASVEKMAHIEAGKTITVNGAEFRGPLFVARHTTLGEISFVPLAGDNKTTAKVAATGSTNGDIDMDFREWVEAQGFDYDDLTDDQRKVLKAAWEAETAPDPQPQPEPQPQPAESVQATGDEAIAQLRQRGADELHRQREITRICAEFEGPQIEADGEQVDLAEYAIANNLTAEQTELRALRASRPAAPAIHSRSHEGECTVEAMQGAMVLAAGVNLDSPHFRGMQATAMGLPSWIRRSINDDDRQRFMEAAHQYSDMSAVDICAEAVRLDGRSVPRGRQAIIQAAFSGSTLTNAFTTSVNAALLETYMQSPDTTMGWTQPTDVNDFKTNERIRVAKGTDLEQLPRGKEADHYELDDSKESYKIHRYARQFVVDEQDLIDDRLQALRETPRMMGQAAARLRPDLVYAILLANAALDDDSVALFHADHSNLNTSSALTHATLKTAIAALEKQQDNSVNLNLRASHVIVPSDLKHTAAELIQSSSLLYGADDETVRGATNTLNSVETMSLVSDARLANGVTDPTTGTSRSGSATTWYLASAMGHTIEVGYLRGTGRAPTVRAFNLTEGRWGIAWDVKMDIGSKATDYRGMVKSTA